MSRPSARFWILDEVAKTGRQQSPIDIDSGLATSVDLFGISFQYRDEKAVFVNNGHTLEHEQGPGNWLTYTVFLETRKPACPKR